MKAIIYARVSTEEQEEKGYSLDAQVDACRKYCEMKGWEIIKIYREVGSAWDSMEKREKFMKAVELVELGVADVIVAWKLDRILRLTEDLIKLKKRIGYKFVSVTENLDGSTAFGRFAIDIAIRVAELSSDLTSERTRLIIKRRIEKGLPHGYPKGRDRIPAWKKEKIIELYKQGKTYREIKHQLKIGDGTIADTLRKAGLIK